MNDFDPCPLAAELGQAGLLRRHLAAGGRPARRERQLEEAAVQIEARRRGWAPPGGGVAVPVLFWDDAIGDAVAAWLLVDRPAGPPDGRWPAALGGDTRTGFVDAGRAAVAALPGVFGAGASFRPLDYRLRIVTPDGLPVSRPLRGRSASAAFARAVHALARGRRGERLPAAIGDVDGAGALRPVERTEEKLTALRREEMDGAGADVVGGAAADGGAGASCRRLAAGMPVAEWLAAEPDAGGTPLPDSGWNLPALIHGLEHSRDTDGLEAVLQALDPAEAPLRHRFLVLRALGAVRSRTGDLSGARAAMAAALDMAEAGLAGEHLDVTDLTELCNNLGVLDTDLHRWRDAAKWLHRGLRLLRRHRGWTARVQRARLTSSLGQLHVLQGRPDRGEPLLRSAGAELGEPRNQNYVAGALVARHRRARQTFRPGDSVWLEEAMELLGRSETAGGFASEQEQQANLCFCLYWRARLEHEAGRRNRATGERIEALAPAGDLPVFPLAAAGVWAGLPAVGERGMADTDAAGRWLARLVRFGDRSPLLRLIALGLTARVLAVGDDAGPVLAAWSYAGPAGDVPAAFGALGVAALEPLESLTPAFQREHACCRELADGHRRWTGRRFATFLDQLAEKIFY
ncbi:MAG TPA: hypothetical protein PLU41_15765 [Acidobacteriota bacterium]|nr:hypothetical protein [Acidobacteriota bacterium]HPB29408.1 hypothetical protein [Acidobacteriota bacterium]HQO27117.1 hypothetical protein [Acidobacteriota bacterium]HQP75485.1 hypothetical protein [Acidobacteriota bacterium]